MEGFFFAMKIVNFYIDGFNFYFGLRSKGWKKYYWLNIVKFCESFLKEDQQLGMVFYFTAVQKDVGKKDRQDLLFSANKLNPKFKLVFGKFLAKKIKTEVGYHKTFEEKQTDVNIAVEMIRNVIFKKADISVLISADSDLIPPLYLIRELSVEHKVFCYFPPKRHSADLQNLADAVINLERYEKRFKDNLLEDQIELSNGFVIKRPENWV